MIILSGGRKKKIPFRRQRMEIDQAVPENAGFGFTVPPPNDPYVADLLQVCFSIFELLLLCKQVFVKFIILFVMFRNMFQFAD